MHFSAEITVHFCIILHIYRNSDIIFNIILSHYKNKGVKQYVQF